MNVATYGPWIQENGGRRTFVRRPGIQYTCKLERGHIESESRFLSSFLGEGAAQLLFWRKSSSEMESSPSLCLDHMRFAA